MMIIAHKHCIVCVLNKIHQNIQRHLVDCQHGWSFIDHGKILILKKYRGTELQNCL